MSVVRVPHPKLLMDITTEQFQKQFKALAARLITADVDALLHSCSLTLVPAGTRIIEYGGPCSTLYLVWQGLLSATIEEGDVKLVLGDIGPGEWVGEVTLIEPGPATASVTCVEDCYLFALSHEAFNRLRASHPGAASLLLHALSLNLAERLRTTSERVIEQIGKSEYRLQDLSAEEKAAKVGVITRLLGMLLGVAKDN